MNVSIVFNHLREHGPSYRADVARTLGLSAPAVSRAVDQLLAEEYVVESGTAVTSHGKSVTEVSVNADRGLVVGVDLLKGESKFGLFDLSGSARLLRRGQRFVDDRRLRPELLGTLESEIRAVVAECAEPVDALRSELLAVCVGIPAAVCHESGRVAGVPLYQDLETLDIKGGMQQAFGVPCFVENDVKLAAFAENRLGRGRQFRHLVYIDINDGIGAGIILDNRLFRGSGGFAGELGYSSSLVDEESGTIELEQVASLAAIGRAGGTGDPRGVFAMAAAGDHAAAIVIDRAVRHMATAILNVVLVVNPELVVIGGDILELPSVQSVFVDPLVALLRRITPFEPPPLVLSEFGAETCVRGAALFAIDALLLGKYPYAAGFDRARAATGGGQPNPH